MSDSISAIRQEKLLSDYLRTGYSKVKKGLNFAVDEAGEGGTIYMVSRVARRFFELLAVFKPIAELFGPAGLFLKGFTQVFQVISIFKHGREIAKHENILKVSIAALGVIFCSMTFVKVIESFRWVDLAKVSLRIGTATLGFTSFMGFVEIAKESLEIILNTTKLVNLSKKIAQVNRKRKFWSEGLTEEKCQTRAKNYTLEGKKLEQTIAELEARKEFTSTKVEKWAPRYQQEQDRLQAQKSRLASQHKVKRVFAKSAALFHKVFPRHVTKKARKWVKLDDKAKAALEKAQKDQSSTLQKKQAFEKMGRRFSKEIPPEKKVRYAEDLKKIGTLCQNKLTKWNFKKINFRWDQAWAIGGIMISVAVIVMSVASIVLLFTGTGGIAVPIVLAALSLVTASFGLGLHLFKKFKKGKPINSVALPDLSRKKKKEEEEKLAKNAQERLRAVDLKN